jgi:hypothetical protein
MQAIAPSANPNAAKTRTYSPELTRALYGSLIRLICVGVQRMLEKLQYSLEYLLCIRGVGCWTGMQPNPGPRNVMDHVNCDPSETEFGINQASPPRRTNQASFAETLLPAHLDAFARTHKIFS